MSTEDDTKSVCSEMSEVGVMYGDDDNVPLDVVVDMIFKQIQEHINEIHVQLRNLVMAEDRNEDYLECLIYHENLSDHVKQGCDVFKSVIKVSKQLLPTKPKGFKDPRKAEGMSKEVMDESFKTD